MTRVVEFETDVQWHSWRLAGIGGSDAPVITGASRFKNRFDLFLEKTGKRRADIANAAMQHGTASEPKARDAYTLQTGNFMPPATVESDKYNWLHASLDGYDPESKLILEIKCPFEIGYFLAAKEGEVPPEYYDQIQHCLAVADALQCHYYCFWEGEGVLIKVDFDPGYWNDDLFLKEQEFWGFVQKQEFPFPQGRVERDDLEWRENEKELYDYLCMRDDLDRRIRKARRNLEKLATAEITKGKLLRASWVYHKGGTVPSYVRSDSFSLEVKRLK